MSNIPFVIDERLLADSHEVCRWNQLNVRLNKNASIPWFLIIPETHEIEFCDLPAKQQLAITSLARTLGRFLKANMNAEKINFAAIGNVVQQLHIHVIGRHSKDPLWPSVVWGNKLPDAIYTQHEIENLKLKLHQALDSAP